MKLENTLPFAGEISEEEKQYFQAFRKAVDEKSEENINLLIRKEGILQKYFLINEGTFLHLVAERGTTETAIEICKLESNVNIQGDFGETPIYSAIKHSAEMVNVLIKNGADVNSRSWKGESPLHHAIRHSAEIVKILLQSGAKVDVTDDNGVTLLHEALLSGTEQTVRLIINKIFSEMQYNYKQAEKLDDIVTLLLKNKEILKITEKDYPLLILFAAKTGDTIILKLMLNEIRKRLDIVKNKWKKYYHIERKFFSRVPAELNLRGYYDRTALHYAVRQQLPEAVRLLLKTGADADCKTKQNFTPLHYAACLENEKICKILVNYGASVNSNKHWVLGNPLYQVCGKSSVKEHLVCNDGYFYEEYNSPNTRFQVYNPKITKLLLENGASTNSRGYKGKTPFLEACTAGNVELLRTLLYFGADLRIRDEMGNSALHYAVQGNSLEIVNFLLEKGMDINIRNIKNCTPLLLLMQECNPKLLEMTEYLVDRGADIDARYVEEITALHMASVFCESVEYVEKLLELGANWKLKNKIYRTLNNNSLYFGTNRKILISFIALTEKKLEHFAFCYFVYDLVCVKKIAEYFEKSKLEVVELKSRKIVAGRKISFHDFLTKSIYTTVQIARHEEIKKVFRSRKYFREFPCYYFLLHKRYERVIALTDAVDRTTNFLMNCLSPLPTLFICEILKLWSSSDFRIFDRSLSRSNRVVTDQNLIFNRIYSSKIVEIRETGIMVSLYPNMLPALLPISQLETDSTLIPCVSNLKVGEEIRVMYQGKYPENGQIRLTGKLT